MARQDQRRARLVDAGLGRARVTPEAIIGVAGAGAMGAGIAEVAARAGHAVIVLDSVPAALDRGRENLVKGLDAQVARGRLEAAEAAKIAARTFWTGETAALAPAALIIEAIIEDAAAKKALFAALERAAPGAILATNTSSLPVTALASGLARPGRFLGLHFFNPATVMKLVEIVPGLETDPALVGEMQSLMERWGKKVVVAKDLPGFIVNRLARPFYGEGWRALEEGAAAPDTIDRLYRELGRFRMGPFELGDLIGHDVNLAAARSVFVAYHGATRFRPSLAQAALVDAGRFGRKSGRGVYSYTEERPAPGSAPAPAGEAGALTRLIEQGEAMRGGVLFRHADGRPASLIAAEAGTPAVAVDYIHDPAATSLIAYSASDDRARRAAAEFASENGKDGVEIADRPGGIVLRALLQLANAAADALRDQAASEGDIDLAMLAGVNYPFGPWEWTRGFGFHRVVEALTRIAEETGDGLYRPSEHLRAAARTEAAAGR
ncbi:MAG: 3-hydroxyacyl-CoA dehydrogenase NAD-binding domain-containing protein [Parvularculaceae bacterium]